MAISPDIYSHILPAYRRQAADALAAHLALPSTKQVQEPGSTL
jgi:hypothetical protein